MHVPLWALGLLLFPELFNVVASRDKVIWKSTGKDSSVYDIVTPVRVNEAGDKFPTSLHFKRKRRSLDENTGNWQDPWASANIHYRIHAFGQSYHLNLTRHSGFLAPLYTVTVLGLHRRDNMTEFPPDGQEEDDSELRHCFYKGYVNSEHAAVISLCSGLMGTFRSPEGEYFVEPLHSYQGQHYEEEHIKPHIVYKKSASKTDIFEDDSTCDTAEHKQRHKRHTQRRRPVVRVPAPMGSSDIFTDIELLRSGIANQVLPTPESSNSSSSRASNDSSADSGPHRRSKRFLSYPRFVEVMLVADSKMVEHHGSNLQHYILTLMSIVSSIYKDPSIGNVINIVIVKLVIINHEQEGPVISFNAQTTLKNFCIWQQSQNILDDNHQSHHDTAILITRQDICRARDKCDTLGLAELGTVCDPYRSCSISEDNGLSTAFTIAHELGHVFNMPHDDSNKCREDGVKVQQHVMAPTLNYNTNPWMWSKCSRKFITEFLDTGYGECLLDEPVSRPYSLSPQLPGGAYNVNKQCELIFGPGTQVCPYMTQCRRLWCTSPEGVQRGCRTQHMPWADGTDCAPGKHCKHGLCVAKEQDASPVEGAWGVWSPFGMCSRTCGGGIKVASRDCNRPVPRNGGMYCVGRRMKFRSCNSEPCSRQKKDFREEQCGAFDGRHFNINGLPPNVRWVPKYSGILMKDRCKLFCRVAGSTAYYQLRDRVIDGTTCGPDTNDICVQGLCRVSVRWYRVSVRVVQVVQGECQVVQGECQVVQGECQVVQGECQVVQVVQGECQVVQGECQVVQGECQVVQGECQVVQGECQVVQGECQVVQGECQVVQGECQVVQGECQVVQRECQVVQGECQVVQGECQVVQRECQVVQGECQVVQGECQVVQRECQVVQGECQVVQGECQVVQRECQVVQGECQVVQVVQGECQVVQGECQVVQRECQVVQGECQVVQGECQVVQGECQVVQGECQVVQGECQVVQGECQVVQGECQVVQRECQVVQVVQGECQVVQGECQVVQGECQVVQGECQVVQGECQVVQRECQVVQGECQVVQGECQVVQGECQVVQGECQVVQGECQVVQGECQVVQGECQVVQGECQVVQGECQVVQGECQVVQGECQVVQVVQGECQVVQGECQVVQGECQVVQGECQVVQGECQVVQGECQVVQVVQGECQVVQGECQVVQGECQVVQGECQVVQGECQVVQGECQVVQVVQGECQVVQGECQVVQGECQVVQGECQVVQGECQVVQRECQVVQGECQVVQGECQVVQGECGTGECQVVQGECQVVQGVVVQGSVRWYRVVQGECQVVQGECQVVQGECQVVQGVSGVIQVVQGGTGGQVVQGEVRWYRECQVVQGECQVVQGSVRWYRGECQVVQVVQGECQVVQGECQVVQGECQVVQGECQVVQGECQVVQGECQQAGCDHVLNSKARRDKCGVCGGDNSSCKPIAGTFNMVRYGYNEVVHIPAGATNIDIRQHSYSGKPEDDNYLAISNTRGEFLLNGEFVVSMFKREIKVGTTILEYSGSDHVIERINCTERIEEEIVVQVLSVGNLYNPDVRYSFNIPIEDRPQHFFWDAYGPWQECSRLCQGERKRKIVCSRESDRVVVSDQRCHGTPRPAVVTETCNNDCELRWFVARKSECSAQCGPGYRPLEIYCGKTNHGDVKTQKVDERYCSNIHKPDDKESCHGDCNPGGWEYSSWSECTKSCGGGTRHRGAVCSKAPDHVGDETMCSQRDKLTVQSCNEFLCPWWKSGDWSECLVTCGKGYKHRQVWCQFGEDRLEDPHCGSAKPESVQPCQQQECASWQVGPWGQCTTSCGPGFQMRAVK
uniref:Peptidase M12B domain-containing protein n=1 Tax=Knipowitschia caucasica TaxID=637954 RepID=A0AAV2M8U5_KNICA